MSVNSKVKPVSGVGKVLRRFFPWMGSIHHRNDAAGAVARPNREKEGGYFSRKVIRALLRS